VWHFLNCNLEESEGQVWAQRYEYFGALLILANVVADVIDSVPSFPFSEDRSVAFRILEHLTCAIFTVEYFCRVWSCVELPTLEGGPLCKRLRFMCQIMPILDLLVLVVFYADILETSDASRGLGSLRVIRTLRLLALLKMERQTQSFQTVFHVLSKRKNDLIATLFLATVLLVIASTAMYYVETEAQPEEFASIPSTMWWSVTAMTTVGYGDIYPTTVPGKILGSVVAFLGVGLFALPSGIISSGFVEVLEERRQAENDEIAEVLEEDKASLDQLHVEVAALREGLDFVQAHLRRGEEERAVRCEQHRELRRELAGLRETLESVQSRLQRSEEESQVARQDQQLIMSLLRQWTMHMVPVESDLVSM